MVFLPGADLLSTGPSSTANGMFSAINTTNKNLYDYKYFGGTGKQFVNAIAGDIKANHSGQSIVIYGYSRGGDMALQLSRALGAMDVTVSLLVTIDAADGPFSSSVDRSLGSNVLVNYNYYQTSSSNPLRSYGGPNSGSGMIYNMNLTGLAGHLDVSPTADHFISRRYDHQ